MEVSLPAGPIRLGPLVLTRPIGQGGMGTVWHARHPEGVDVAVKVLRPEYAADAELMDTFRQEVRSVASLDHPNLVRVYDYGAVPPRIAAASGDLLLPGSPWLAMEFASGGTLADHPPAASWAEVVDLAGQILDGLGHSHARDIVHRDLKPRNVLLHPPQVGDPDEEDTVIPDPLRRNRLRITITDFGIAHALTRRSADHAQAGTPGYMAPEQIRGRWRDQGPWTDLYALGCLTWRMIAGRSPFAGDTKRQVLRAQLDGRTEFLSSTFPLPSGAEDWLRRMIEVKPRDRFACAADASHALRAIGLSTPSTPWPPQPDDWRPTYPPTTVRPAGTGLALFLLRPWPLVGRDALQDQLWRRLRAVRDLGRAQCVVLTGPEGIGKSRLARWVGERAAETGVARVLRVQQDREGNASLRTAIRAQLGLTGLQRDEARDRLQAWLEQDLETTEDPPQPADVDDLLDLLDPVSDDLDATRIDDDPQLWLAILDRIAGGRPMVLVVDDLQVSDAAPLLTVLAGSARQVLAIATLDPALLPSSRRHQVERLLEVGSTLRVEPLRSAELRRLVDEGIGVSPRLAESLVDRIGGNPAMAVQLVTDWARRGLLIPTTTGFDLRDGADVRLPDQLVARLVSILEGLTPEDQVAVEILAALGGRRIRDEEWAAVCHQAAVRFDDQSRRRLITAEVARSRRERNAARWSLEPLLLREVALDQARAAGRAKGHHEAAARVLMASRRPSAQERAIVHLVDAGHPSAALKALRSLIEALDSDPDRQAALVDTERRLFDALRIPKGDPRRLPAELDELQHAGRNLSITELRELLPKVATSGDATLCARVYRQVVERLDGALRLQPDDPVLSDAERWQRVADDPSGWVWVRTARGLARWRSGDGAGADQELDEALTEARTKGLDPITLARALRALGEVRCQRGDPTGPALLEEAAAAFAAEDDVAGVASVEVVRSRVARLQGDLVDGLERGRRAAKLLVEALRETAPADLQVGLCRLARGEITQARAELQAVVEADQPGISVVAQGALLATLVSPPDWQPWDSGLRAWRAHAREGALVDGDSAWPIEWAAKRAVDAGAFDRAIEAYELAAHQYALAGDRDAMTRVRRRLRTLDTAAPEG